MRVSSQEFEKKYLEHGGAICPICESTHIRGGSFEVADGCCWQDVSCPNCGARWDDVYNLVGITNLIIPDLPVSEHPEAPAARPA